MTDEKLEHLRQYFTSLSYEIGFPCIHREPKNYIDDKNLRTWSQVFNNYLNFPLQYPDSNSDDGNKDSDGSEGEELINDDINEVEALSIADINESLKFEGDNSSDDSDVSQNEMKGKQSYIAKAQVIDRRSNLPKVLSKLTWKQKQFFMETKITAFTTWLKYKTICYPHIRLQILKEDCCDTCTKLELLLAGNEINEIEKEALREALAVSYI